MTARPRSGERRHTPELAAGRVIAGRYEIEEVLGAGSSGTVYRARTVAGATPVALKVLHPHLSSDRQILGRFHREARILKRLTGDHLVPLLDLVEEEGLVALALELVDGEPLDEVLASGRTIDLDETIEVMLQVCAALGVAHAAGVIHRDLKPANVLLSRRAPRSEEGGPKEKGAGRRGLHVRVVDFGLAKLVHGSAARTGLTEHDMIFGTPEYMAPELARGDEADARADLYAAGIMLYELATGRVPFTGPTPISAMTAHLVETPLPPRRAAPGRGISPSLEAVILRAMDRDPSRRYPSARALAEALAGIRERHVIAVERVSEPGALESGDTALSLRRESLELRATEPAAVAAENGAPSGPRPTPEPSPPGELRGWVWIAVAVVAASTGLLLGLVLGAR